MAKWLVGKWGRLKKTSVSSSKMDEFRMYIVLDSIELQIIPFICNRSMLRTQYQRSQVMCKWHVPLKAFDESCSDAVHVIETNHNQKVPNISS